MVDESVAVRGVAAAFLTVASISVLLRCYVRLFIVKAFGWDDIVMIFSMLFYIMFCGCMIGGSLWGTGKHLVDLTPDQRATAMEYWFLCDIGYAAASILCKVSVCIFLLRVMILPLHRRILYAVTVATVLTGVVFFILIMIQCTPVSYFWMRMKPNTSGSCRYVDGIIIMLYVFSAVSALFDITVGLLPILLVRKLQMNRQTKMAVAGLMGMACIASVAVIIRIPFVQTIRDPDFLYATVEIAIWSNIETGLAITAGSLATIRPLFRILHSRTGSSYHVFDHSTPQSKKRIAAAGYQLDNLKDPPHTSSASHNEPDGSILDETRFEPALSPDKGDGTLSSSHTSTERLNARFWDGEEGGQSKSRIGVHRTFEISMSDG